MYLISLPSANYFHNFKFVGILQQTNCGDNFVGILQTNCGNILSILLCMIFELLHLLQVLFFIQR